MVISTRRWESKTIRTEGCAGSSLILKSRVVVVLNGAFNPFPHVVSPGGFLYCGVQDSGSVMEFAINPFTGALTRVGTFVTSKEPVAGPVGISFDPSGRNAYVGNTGGIAQFRVNRATGALVGTNAVAASSNDAFLWGALIRPGGFSSPRGAKSGPTGLMAQLPGSPSMATER